MRNSYRILLALVSALFLFACSKEFAEETSSIPLGQIPKTVIRIDQVGPREEDRFALDGRNYSGKELIAYLASRPAETLTDGILYFSHDKRLQKFDVEIKEFCRERKIDLFMRIPSGARPADNKIDHVTWVVKAAK